jgi:hypothetical protein
LSEAELIAAAKHCKIQHPGEWIGSGFGACTHHWLNDKQEVVCVVCLNADKCGTPLELAGLLVHEAVHVWQEYCESINESKPGREQEAYAIQGIAQELMMEYARRLK